MPTIELPGMHTAQQQIVASDARFKCIAAGRRFGKTMLLAGVGFRRVTLGGHVLWIAPSYQIGEIGWRMLRALAAQIGAKIKEGEKRVEYAGGWAQIRSADSAGGLRGESVDLAIFDEAAHIANLERIWEQEVRPSLADNKGRAYFISTPKGFNYFADLFNQKGDEWQSFQFPTTANPYIDPAEVEAARLQLPALVFRQEYMAEFVQLAGAMFRREYFQFSDTLPRATIRHWDLAASTKTQADYSVGALGGLDDDGRLFVADVVRGRWEWPALIRIIRDTALSDGNGVIQSVETAGTQKGMLDLLLAEPALAGIAFRGVTPTQDKITRAQPVLARAEQGKLVLRRAAWNAIMIDEFCAFPETEHDDQVDAVSGMLAACANLIPASRMIDFA